MRTQAGLQNALSQITAPKCPEMCGDWEIGDQCSLADGTFNETACSSCDPPVLCRFTKYTKQGFGFVSWMQWFNLFGFYWAMNFITAYGEIILAGVFAKWYWTKHKSDIPVTTVCSSIFNATVYHLGTIAFGSLIIAIIKVFLLNESSSFIALFLNPIQSIFHFDVVSFVLFFSSFELSYHILNPS